jgi:hypothetical protein
MTRLAPGTYGFTRGREPTSAAGRLHVFSTDVGPRVDAGPVASAMSLLCLVGYHVPARKFRREYNTEGELVALICPRCGVRKDPGSGAVWNTPIDFR